MMLTRRQKLALLLWCRRRNRMRRRSISVHPINARREALGEFHHLMAQMREDDEKFVSYLRMKQDKFDQLLNLCSEDLTKTATNFCKPISPEERLVVTLRFLATGESFSSLGFRFRMGFTTVCVIVQETVQVLWTRLQPTEMPVPDEDSWKNIAREFFTQWNFPLCVGAIDDKHIRIKAPRNAGSKYFNYKGFHSVVVMAVSDARGRFIVIDVGAYGSCSDGGIIQDSTFYKLVKADKLNIPKLSAIPGTDIEAPYVFVADEAFPLTTNIMTPFPRRDLSDDKRIFNYRLSRARRQVECAFGIASAMWRVLMNCIEVQDTFACDIVKAVCVLHNFVMNSEAERIQRFMAETTQPQAQQSQVACISRRPGGEAMAVRELFMSYFTSPGGSLEWQHEK